MRPKSIILFEQLFFANLLLGLVNMALAWNTVMEQALVSANSGGSFVLDPALLQGIMIGSMAFGVAIQLLLWFFVARKGSDVARWIYVILFAFGMLGFVMTITRGAWLPGIAGIIAGLSYLLQIAAVVMLFRPDSQAWFGRNRRA